MFLAQPKTPRAGEQEEDVYDDGHLRVEHGNYYAACGDLPLKEFLIASRLARSYCLQKMRNDE